MECLTPTESSNQNSNSISLPSTPDHTTQATNEPSLGGAGMAAVDVQGSQVNTWPDMARPHYGFSSFVQADAPHIFWGSFGIFKRPLDAFIAGIGLTYVACNVSIKTLITYGTLCS